MYTTDPSDVPQRTPQMYTTDPSDVHNGTLRCTQQTHQMYTTDPSDVHNRPLRCTQWTIRCTKLTPQMYTTDPSYVLVHNRPLRCTQGTPHYEHNGLYLFTSVQYLIRKANISWCTQSTTLLILVYYGTLLCTSAGIMRFNFNASFSFSLDDFIKHFKLR